MNKLQPIVIHLRQSSPLCKIFYGVVIIGFVVSRFRWAYESLSISPADVLPPRFELWTLISYFVIETNALLLLWTLASVHLASTVVEPLWGHFELIKFFAIVNLSVALSVTASCFILYALTEQPSLFFDVNFCGLTGFDGAVLVAIKQIFPDTVLLQTPMGRIKNSHLPFLFITILVFLGVVGVVNMASVAALPLGVVSSWIYLRFYQPHNSGVVGDATEHFSFSSFFPSAVQPLVSAVSDPVYRLLVKLKVCRPAIRRYIDMTQLQNVNVILPGIAVQDADRRRQKALKELTERLQRAKDGDGTTSTEQVADWPEMGDASSPSPPIPITHPSPPPMPLLEDIPPSTSTVSTAPETETTPTSTSQLL